LNVVKRKSGSLLQLQLLIKRHKYPSVGLCVSKRRSWLFGVSSTDSRPSFTNYNTQ